MGKNGPEVFAFVQNGQPTQAGLKAFEAYFLKQTALISHRKPPFRVMVLTVKRAGLTPRSAVGVGLVGKQDVVKQVGWFGFGLPDVFVDANFSE